MALEREVWVNHIKEGFFPENSFLTKAQNLSVFVENKTVHVPNAGAPPGVQKNRSTFPATVGKREDTDLKFDIDEYTTDPLRISNKEKVELSYDKRQSVIGSSKNKLINDVSEDVLLSWQKGALKIVDTSGEAVPAHTPGATGNRKALTRADILNLSTQFNADDIPSEGRFLILDAIMYAQLLSNLTEADKGMLNATADTAKGIIGQLFTFNIMMRAKVGRYTGSKADKAWATAGSATDIASGLAWHTDSVGVALGDIKMFEHENDPTYYGDIVSFLLRAGGSHIRTDKKGVVAIAQASAT